MKIANLIRWMAPLALFASAASTASADILYINFNVASSEIVNAREAAQARGEKLLVYPQISADLEQRIDAEYQILTAAEDRFQNCQKANAQDCSSLLAKYLTASNKVNELTSSVKRVDRAGLTTILANLESGKTHLTSLVLSGHSSGMGNFIGLYGALDIEDVNAAFAAHPSLIPGLRSILLWGCYSGTLNSLDNFWRKGFPQTLIFGGFEDRAPLGIRDSSGRFLKSFLLHERTLIAAKTMREQHEAFKQIDDVADVDGAAIVRDTYMTYDRAASVEEMLGRCEKFDSTLLDKFNCYDQGQPGCEMPPADHQGSLRTLYSFLQVNRHCTPILEKKYPSIPTTDYLVRLIFLDNIKVNLDSHYRSQFQTFQDSLSEVGLSASLGMNGFVHSNRTHDAQAFKTVDAAMQSQGSRDGSLTEVAGWRNYLLVQHEFSGLAQLLGPSHFYSFGSSCVPFSWVDPGSQENDTCGLATWIQKSPYSAETEKRLLVMFYRLKTFTEMIPGTDDIPPGSLADMKKQFKQYLAGWSGVLQAYPDRSPREEARLADLLRIDKEVEALDGKTFGTYYLDKIQISIDLLTKSLADAQASPHNEDALEYLQPLLKLCTDGAGFVRAAINQMP